MTPTESMLLRAVLESPGDDTPRLAYADEIQATEPLLAEGIIWGCSNPQYSRVCLCLAVGHRGDDPCETCREMGESVAMIPKRADRETAYVVNRGFVNEVRATLAVLMGGECPTCGGMSCTFCGGNDRDYHTQCNDCPACFDTGRVPGIGRELFGRQPVTRVEVEDGVEHVDRDPGFDAWRMRDAVVNQYTEAMKCSGIPERVRLWGWFPTESAARTALSDALVAHFREQAGLPPLEVQK